MYDYIIAGGGCAGLSLAYHIALRDELKDKKILIIDQDKKDRNDRTWCFWTDKPTLFDEIIKYSWDKIEFCSTSYGKIFSLGNYKYQKISGIDYYNFILEKLSENKNFKFINSKILDIRNLDNSADVITEDGTFQSQYIFNSFLRKDFIKNEKKYHYVMQHFKGWEIETKENYFDTETMRFMDFSIPQNNKCQFVYILPFKSNRALIEYTLFSCNLLMDSEYDLVLKNYIENKLNIKNYVIKEKEFGVIPMTDHPFPEMIGNNIINIGTTGGQTKASTGYTFLNIHKNSQKIVESIIKNGKPIISFDNKIKFRLYDSLLLNVMTHEGESIGNIFTHLFQNNPISLIFRFLGEETSLAEDIKIISSLPYLPFLKSLTNRKLLSKLNI